MGDALALLASAQAALHDRFDDFRQALERRDEDAYRLALADFHHRLCLWTSAEEKALLPAVLRAGLKDRNPKRELLLEYVQLRELTAHIRKEMESRGRLSDLLGYVENLARRLKAHEQGNLDVYFPAGASLLSPSERQALEDAAPAE